ncbi:MAG: methyltransferase domain-containing protein [Anaerolineae bacterium]|nr:methyltransferase domain-containing protein [Anaerolineae bacterium]
MTQQNLDLNFPSNLSTAYPTSGMPAPFVALCIRLPGSEVNELIAAECSALTGGQPDADGVALCQTLDSIPQAAYVRTGLRCVAHGTTFEALLVAIRQASLNAPDFRIDALQLSGKFPVPELEAIVAASNQILFRPNLRKPQHRFLLVAQATEFWLGEILAESAQGYACHRRKPYHVSSSLDARLARALVNLVASQAHSLIDPCCGTGSILLEAHSLGLETYGADANPKMMSMARRNLEHFGHRPQVDCADAREWLRTADALVTDLPYGHRLESVDAIIPDILRHTCQLAPTAVYVAGDDISHFLASAGYRKIEILRVIKHNSFIRYVHRAVV